MRAPPLVTLAFLISPVLLILAGEMMRPDPTATHHKTTPPAFKTSSPPRASGETSSITTINYAPAFDPRHPFASPTDQQAQDRSLFDPQDDYWGLPRTEGVDEIASLCTACHSLEIVMQQRMSSNRWAYTLQWMSEKQGMVELDPQTYELVYNYLTEHFSDQ